MKNKDLQSNSNTDVFEMILRSAGAYVRAAPSEKRVEDDWHADHEEGRLAVDVAENRDEIIVISTMAGADTGRVEVYLHNDLLTIRGVRERPTDCNERLNYFHEECYWGRFSRTIILPVNVAAHKAKAEYRNGVLTVVIPKQDTEPRVPIIVVDD